MLKGIDQAMIQQWPLFCDISEPYFVTFQNPILWHHPPPPRQNSIFPWHFNALQNNCCQVQQDMTIHVYATELQVNYGNDSKVQTDMKI